MTDVQRWNEYSEDSDGEYVLYTDYAALETECKRYREALEKIKADTHNRPGREPWDYYCDRLHKILMITMEALGGQDADK